MTSEPTVRAGRTTESFGGRLSVGDRLTGGNTCGGVNAAAESGGFTVGVAD